MSAHVLLNLLNTLCIKYKMRGLQSKTPFLAFLIAFVNR